MSALRAVSPIGCTLGVQNRAHSEVTEKHECPANSIQRYYFRIAHFWFVRAVFIGHGFKIIFKVITLVTDFAVRRLKIPPSCNLRGLVIIFFTVAFSIPITDVMFISTSVTLNTIVEITDAFLDVLVTDACRRVFVATVAGVMTIVVAHMTRHTARVVIAV